MGDATGMVGDRWNTEFEELLAAARESRALEEWIDHGDRYEFRLQRCSFSVVPADGLRLLKAIIRRHEMDQFLPRSSARSGQPPLGG